MMHNEPSVTKIGVDTAENGLRKGLKKVSLFKVPDSGNMTTRTVAASLTRGAPQVLGGAAPRPVPDARPERATRLQLAGSGCIPWAGGRVSYRDPLSVVSANHPNVDRRGFDTGKNERSKVFGIGLRH